MAVQVERQGEVAVVTVINPPVNALNHAMRQGLFDAVATLDARSSVKAVVLIADGRTFIAGADISEFGKPPQPPHLPAVIARIEGAAKPWIAAIHGTALGGGLEVALGCRWRVAVSTAKFGLPEVTLGIVPGAGGTVRLPRLVPLADAVEMVTEGRPVSATRAKTIGLVDALIDRDLLSGAIEFVQTALTQTRPVPLSQRDPGTADEQFWADKAVAIKKRARGEAAPLRALDCVRKAAEFELCRGHGV